jgi:hypothetical protein
VYRRLEAVRSRGNQRATAPIARDGSGDEDGDDLTDLEEACLLGTDPGVADTDGDGEQIDRAFWIREEGQLEGQPIVFLAPDRFLDV